MSVEAKSSLTVKQSYELLQVKSDCTDEALKAAYRKAALLLHPDKNLNNVEATAQFQKLQAAKEIIEQQRNGPDRPSFEFDIDEILMHIMFMSGAFGFQRPHPSRSSSPTPRTGGFSRGYKFKEETDDADDYPYFDDDDDDDDWNQKLDGATDDDDRDGFFKSSSSFKPPPVFQTRPMSSAQFPSLKSKSRDPVDEERLRQAAKGKPEEEEKMEKERQQKKAEEKKRKEENKKKAQEAERQKQEAEEVARQKVEEAKIRQEQQAKRSAAFQRARANDISGLQAALATGVSAQGVEFLDKKRHPGEPLIHVATQSNNPEMLGIVVSHGARVDEMNSKGRSPLHIAILANAFKSTEWLLKHNASPMSLDHQRKSPLGYAVERGLPNFFDLMIQHGATHEVRHGMSDTLAEFVKDRLDMNSIADDKRPTPQERACLIVMYERLLKLFGKKLPKEYGSVLVKNDIKFGRDANKTKADTAAAKTVEEKLKKDEETRMEAAKQLESFKAKATRKKKSKSPSRAADADRSNTNQSTSKENNVSTSIGGKIACEAKSSTIKSQKRQASTKHAYDIRNNARQPAQNGHPIPQANTTTDPKQTLQGIKSSATLNHRGRKKKSPAAFESPTRPSAHLDSLVASLIDMGFDEKESRTLLKTNKLDVALTIDQLTTKMNLHSPEVNGGMNGHGPNYYNSKLDGNTSNFHNCRYTETPAIPSKSQKARSPPFSVKVPPPGDAKTPSSSHTLNDHHQNSHLPETVSNHSTAAPYIAQSSSTPHNANGYNYQTFEHATPRKHRAQTPESQHYQPYLSTLQQQYSSSNMVEYSLFSQPGFVIPQAMNPMVSSPYTSTAIYPHQSAFYNSQMVFSPFDVTYQFQNWLPKAFIGPSEAQCVYSFLPTIGLPPYNNDIGNSQNAGHTGSTPSESIRQNGEAHGYKERSQPSPPKQTRPGPTNKNGHSSQNKDGHMNDGHKSLRAPSKSSLANSASSSNSLPHKYRTAVCRHFQRGRCDLGDDCRFLHPANAPKE